MLHFFIACTKFHHVASCMNSSRVQAQKYIKKSSRSAKAHVRSLARTHVYCYNKNGQMIVDRKELSKKTEDGHLKKGNLTLSSQAETANMRLHMMSAFLQKHSLL